MSNQDDYYLADIFASTHSDQASGSPAEELHRVMPTGLSEIEKKLTDMLRLTELAQRHSPTTLMIAEILNDLLVRIDDMEKEEG